MPRSRSSLALLMVVAALAAAGGVAHAQDDSAQDPAAQSPAPESADTESSATVFPPGPLGRSYADWSGDWSEWIVDVPIPETDCSIADQGGVTFLPFGLPGVDLACTVDDAQYLLVAIGNPGCGIDTSLQKRAKAATGAKAEQLQQQVVEDRARAFTCLTQAPGKNVPDAFLTVDGMDVPLEGYWTISRPWKAGDHKVWSLGYTVMVEPMAAGSHVLEVGWTQPVVGPYHWRIDIEVVPATE